MGHAHVCFTCRGKKGFLRCLQCCLVCGYFAYLGHFGLFVHLGEYYLKHLRSVQKRPPRPHGAHTYGSNIVIDIYF